MKKITKRKKAHSITQSKYSFKTQDLLIISILGVMGGFISGLIPFSLLVKTWYPFVGGTQLVSGHHLLWSIIAYGMTKKKSSALLTGGIKGFVMMLLGDTDGALEIFVSCYEAFFLILGFMILEKLGEGDTYLGWSIAGGVGNASQVPLFWFITGKIYILHITLFLLALMFAFASGAIITGILGKKIVERLKKSGIVYILDFNNEFDLNEHSTNMYENNYDSNGKLEKNAENIILEDNDNTKHIYHENYSINFSDVSFRYNFNKLNSLNNINLKIPKGSFVFLGGKSGSGKSTLCNIISGQIPFKIPGKISGELKLFDRDLFSFSSEELAVKIGYVFQNAEEQLVTFNVYDEIAFAVENLCIEPEMIRLKVNEIAQQLNISNLLDRSIESLSGGEKQRVILAATLVTDPEILILDEPLAFLDLYGEKDLLNILKKIHKERNKLTIIIIEHRISLFEDIIDKLIMLDEFGTIKFDGLINKYKDEVNNAKNTNKFGDIELLEKFPLRDIIIHENFETIIKEHNDKNKNDIIKSNEDILVKIEDINFQYINNGESTPIFDNLSMNIEKGEFIGIIGENGCGKTTLLYLIARILNPTNGSLYMNGINYENINRGEFYSNIGFIFQNPENQIFESTISKEILFGPKNLLENELKINPNMENEIIDKFLPLIDSNIENQSNLAEKNPFRLSWGQKRRLNLASIFSYNAELLLVDEPFIGQDAFSVNEIFSILHEYHNIGKTIVIISHDVDLLSKHCSRLVFLEKFDKNNTNKKDSNKDDIEPLQNKRKESSPTMSYKKKKKLDSFLENSFSIEPEKSWLSEINPLVKLVSLVLISILVFFQKSIIILFFGFLLIVFISWTAKISPKLLFSNIRVIFWMTVFFIPLNILFNASINPNDEILFYIYLTYFPIRRLTVYYAIRTGLIILSLFSCAILFTKTTFLKSLVYSLIQAGIPYRYAFAFMIALRYIPLIQNESKIIEIAQRLRGFGVRKKSSVKKIFQHITFRITTLLISIFRKAHTTSMAIEIRCFGVYDERTNLYKVKWNKKDTVLLIIIIVGSIIGILYGLNLFPNLLPPSIYSIYLKF